MTMEVVVHRSCLQRPKNVVFEGFGEKGLVIGWRMMKKKKTKKKMKCKQRLESFRESVRS